MENPAQRIDSDMEDFDMEDSSSSTDSGPPVSTETHESSSTGFPIPCPVAVEQVCPMVFPSIEAAAAHSLTHGFQRPLFPCPYAGQVHCSETPFTSLEGACFHGQTHHFECDEALLPEGNAEIPTRYWCPRRQCNHESPDPATASVQF